MTRPRLLGSFKLQGVGVGLEAFCKGSSLRGISRGWRARGDRISQLISDILFVRICNPTALCSVASSVVLRTPVPLQYKTPFPLVRVFPPFSRWLSVSLWSSLSSRLNHPPPRRLALFGNLERMLEVNSLGVVLSYPPSL